MARGCLVMAYGTPEREDDLLAYYTDIRRGRPPTDEQLADLRRRYDAIGGLSPLAALTRQQAAALQEALGADWIVELGLKHAAPKIEDGAAALAARGVDDVVGIVLAPHASALSTGQYHERAAAALEAAFTPIPYRTVGRWGHHPVLVELLASRVRGAMAQFPYGERVELLVTAHSLPERVLSMDDPTYPDQLQETADLVAASSGIAEGHYRIAWQSAGRTPEPWLGPDILEVIRTSSTSVLACPAGFTADHLEVLYDLDIEAKGVAAEAGIHFERTASLNADPSFIALLRNLVDGAT
ncbi:MAG TPA: ferrochelatase [Acidimicrobiales bacterium]|jgi:protoporphyrin/coproporphyrin ferrochelatase|nr:ferrochelatase [Acidimicrobiales bacterium]